MPLTREFKQTIMADLQDRDYRAAYLAQAIEAMHSGEFAVGKRMLRNYINATVGFEALSKAVGSPAKSLMRMLEESSNPHADELFGMLQHLQEADRFEIKVVPRARRSHGSERARSAGARGT
jgi:DNA-binding phage protein